MLRPSAMQVGRSRAIHGAMKLPSPNRSKPRKVDPCDPLEAQVKRDWLRMQNPRFGWLANLLSAFVPKRSDFGQF